MDDSKLYYFEDFAAGQSQELGTVTVSQEEIITFARQFDPQPFHIDPERAKESFFGTLVASGWHTVGLYMRLLVDTLLNQTASLGSPGVDEIRWTKPVKPGDTLSGSFTILECIPSRSRPTVGIVRGRGEARNQHGEVVMTLLTTAFFGRRPATPSASDASTLSTENIRN